MKIKIVIGLFASGLVFHAGINQFHSLLYRFLEDTLIYSPWRLGAIYGVSLLLPVVFILIIYYFVLNALSKWTFDEVRQVIRVFLFSLGIWLGMSVLLWVQAFVRSYRNDADYYDILNDYYDRFEQEIGLYEGIINWISEALLLGGVFLITLNIINRINPEEQIDKIGQ
ncbi:MAG: hypothetical protein MRZ79_15520 [Bacteroidia bacterium]|nr:hypothetical protein [Bacteroidia bacterium]